MLIQFSVSNYLSFNGETTFDMFPTQSQVKGEHIIEDLHGKRTSALLISTLYGANASGKSNFISAVEFLCDFVVKGKKMTNDKNEITVIPFLLDETCQNKPSRFEVLFKTGNVAYSFGCVLSAQRVQEEWLYAYYTAKESLVFERKWDDEAGQYEFEFGSKLRLNKKQWAETSSEKELFITYASTIKSTSAAIKPVYDWFNNIVFVHNLAKYGAMPFQLAEDKDFAKFISEALSCVDTGVVEVTAQKKEFTEKQLQKLPLTVREALKLDKAETDTKPYTWTLLAYHKTLQGNKTPFSIRMESDGTERMLHLLPILYMLTRKEYPKLFFIDELDNSLHSALSRWFINQFLSKRGESQAQLIFTTHDTNLLSSDILRKDEIWFVEKDPRGASRFVRLSEYKTSDGLNWENGYISGRFGGIPVISPDHNF